jgi:hypothetical protein
MKMGAASLRALWRGELPVEVAFWRYLVAYGFTINLAASLAMLLAFTASMPTALAILLHVLPVPYNAVAAIGAWRSAEKEKASAFAGIAKMAVPAVFLLWLVV